MLNLSLFLLAVAVIAGILGFGGVAESGAGLAQLLFFICMGLFLITAYIGRREFANYKVENVEDATRTTFF
jgi:uncharacterized membrane protein YtjA (UPF0391 family)